MSDQNTLELADVVAREFDSFLRKRSEVRRALEVQREFDKYLKKRDEIRQHSQRRRGLAALAAAGDCRHRAS